MGIDRADMIADVSNACTPYDDRACRSEHAQCSPMFKPTAKQPLEKSGGIFVRLQRFLLLSTKTGKVLDCGQSKVLHTHAKGNNKHPKLLKSNQNSAKAKGLLPAIRKILRYVRPYEKTNLVSEYISTTSKNKRFVDQK